MPIISALRVRVTHNAVEQGIALSMVQESRDASIKAAMVALDAEVCLRFFIYIYFLLLLYIFVDCGAGEEGSYLKM